MPVGDHVIHLENGQLADDSPRSAVDQLVQRALDHGENGILVHFHGGLVSRARGTETAGALYEEYLKAGAYPVFFVWESGLIETITNNVGEIRKERIFKLLWKRLANIVLRKISQSDDQRAFGDLPTVNDSALQAAIDQATEDDDETALRDTEPAAASDVSAISEIEQITLEEELALDIELTDAIEEIANSLRTPAEIEADRTSRSVTVQGSTATLMDPNRLGSLIDRPDPSERGFLSTAAMIKAVVAVSVKVIARFIDGRDHGFHATLVEEILREFYLANVGQFLWDQMKQDTADAFGGDERVHGGTAFVASLRDRMDPNAPPRITLVGHSTGAVYISEFLDAAIALLPASVQFDVIFHAPASTFEKTSATIVKHAQRIAGFRMFTMNDEHERADRLVPVVYPHSLLYFVSGVVEKTADTPIVGMARFFDQIDFPDADFTEIKVVRDYIGGPVGSVAWSITPDTAGSGRRTTATSHGAFDDDDAATLESVAHIIGHGFD